jgi:hypothetical protein
MIVILLKIEETFNTVNRIHIPDEHIAVGLVVDRENGYRRIF